MDAFFQLRFLGAARHGMGREHQDVLHPTGKSQKSLENALCTAGTGLDLPRKTSGSHSQQHRHPQGWKTLANPTFIPAGNFLIPPYLPSTEKPLWRFPGKQKLSKHCFIHGFIPVSQDLSLDAARIFPWIQAGFFLGSSLKFSLDPGWIFSWIQAAIFPQLQMGFFLGSMNSVYFSHHYNF